jgi:hypothetical protein
MTFPSAIIRKAQLDFSFASLRFFAAMLLTPSVPAMTFPSVPAMTFPSVDFSFASLRFFAAMLLTPSVPAMTFPSVPAMTFPSAFIRDSARQAMEADLSGGDLRRAIEGITTFRPADGGFADHRAAIVALLKGAGERLGSV